MLLKQMLLTQLLLTEMLLTQKSRFEWLKQQSDRRAVQVAYTRLLKGVGSRPTNFPFHKQLAISYCTDSCSNQFSVLSFRFHPFTGHEGPQGEYRYSSTLFQTSALEGVRGQLHTPAANYPQERPGTHCTGGWVGLRTGLDRYGKSRPHRDSIPGPFSPQAVGSFI